MEVIFSHAHSYLKAKALYDHSHTMNQLSQHYLSVSSWILRLGMPPGHTAHWTFLT